MMTDSKLCFRCAVPHCVFYRKNHRGSDGEIECSKFPEVPARLALDECKFFEERSHVDLAKD